jgi:hypothetical protein
MISDHIQSLGIELECGMDDDGVSKLEKAMRVRNLSSYLEVDGDSSVNVPDKDASDLEIRFWNADLKNVLAFLKAAYVDCGAKTNSTCGFHVHVKIDDFGLLTYETCFSRFLRLYRKHYALNSKYISRLSNHYCKTRGLNQQFVSDLLSGNDNHDNRYFAINFLSIKQHDTIEFRIFPNQSTYTEAKSTINWFIQTIEGIFASKHPKLYDQTIDFTRSLEAQTNQTAMIPSNLMIKYSKFVTKKIPINTQLQSFGSIGSNCPIGALQPKKHTAKRSMKICAK